MLAKSKVNSIEVLIYKALINSVIVLKEYNKTEEEIKNSKT